jgi:hypothetical protein
MLFGVTFLVWQVRRRDRSAGLLAVGLWGNLLAVHVFGLTDAIALGAKVGLFFWVDLGLIAALHACVVADRDTVSVTEPRAGAVAIKSS